MNIQFSVSWLREYLKTDAASKTIANLLTASGPSVERVTKAGNDYIWDVEVTTNRPDAFSVFGIAREANAILLFNKQKTHLVEPEGTKINLDPDTTRKVTLDVKIENSKLCPRFTAIILEVKIGQSPALIQNRLNASGIRPINNVVDITNYVMLETGQPMHAFDFDKIEGSKMILRESKEKETLTTLDGQKKILPTGTIVITDAKKIIDLCGIMGGQNSQITKRTKRCIFFVQAYDPIKIRKATQALAFRTDAASRFEKGVDLENILTVLKRSVYLAKKNADAKIISELIDIYPVRQKNNTVQLKLEKLNDYLGIELQPETALSILTSLSFQTEIISNTIKATTPTFRSGDIKDDVDLIEEIARIYGYSNIPGSLPQGQIPKDNDTESKVVQSLKNALRYQGLREVITYSIVSAELAGSSGIKPNQIVEIKNPLTQDWQYMRPSIMPSLLEVIAKNQNLTNHLKIFEIAKTYLYNKNGLPTQDLFITVAVQTSDFFELKGLVENIFRILKRNTSLVKTKNENNLIEQKQSADIIVNKLKVGTLGLVKAHALNKFNLNNNVGLIDINLTNVFSQPHFSHMYSSISKFPPVIEDISAIFSSNTSADLIIAEIKKASALLKQAVITDVFEGESIGEGKKSVTVRLTFQKQTGTPTQDEVHEEKQKIVEALEKSLRAKIRTR